MNSGCLQGNLVLPERAGYGRITWRDGVIAAVEAADEVRPGANWVLPGFIDLHFHGLGRWGSEDGESVRGIAGFAPSTGVTAMLPTLSSTAWEHQLEYLREIRALQEAPPPGARVLGAHLEGPFIEPGHKGGMNPRYLYAPTEEKLEQLLAAGDGALKLITLSPELPGALAVIRRLSAAGVVVSAGHTGCSPEVFTAAVDAGLRQVCHLFDTFDGRTVVQGVTQCSLADAALLEDRVRVELIADGFHVPPELIRLARRAAGADRIVVVTDAMQGTGLPDAVYAMPDGREFKLENGDVCRLTDEKQIIVGSCLTMKQAFFNLTGRFGFTPAEAGRALATNAAAQLGLGDRLGSLRSGLRADLVELAFDRPEVLSCRIDGKEAAL